MKLKSLFLTAGLVLVPSIIVSAPSANALPKPPAADCEAAAIIVANSTEYMIAEYEGRLSPAERSRWTADQLAEFERELTEMRPDAHIARLVADKLEKIDVTDAQFDAAEDMDGDARKAFIAQCHAAYVT